MPLRLTTDLQSKVYRRAWDLINRRGKRDYYSGHGLWIQGYVAEGGVLARQSDDGFMIMLGDRTVVNHNKHEQTTTWAPVELMELTIVMIDRLLVLDDLSSV